MKMSLLVDLEHEYRSVRGSMLRNSDEVPAQLRHEKRRPPDGPGRNLTEERVVVQSGLLIHIAVTGASGVDSLTGSIVSNVVDALGNRQSGQLLAGLGVQNDD